MAENGDGTVEGRLRQAGRRLLQPQPSVQELITLLDQVARWLSVMELLSPAELEASISPLPKALVANEVAWHPNPDVSVAVACCLCEILRITAPEPIYEDNGTLKAVLELIVHCLKDLADTSSPSYNRRVKILEIVSNHRLGALMLEFEVLAAEMFDIFIDTIREDQPENFFSLMETAMTEVLELFNDDEDISAELIAPLLAALRKDNQQVQPIAVDLAKNVIENCADKLRPHLIEAVKYLDTSLDDYSDFVASICEDSSGSETDDGSPSASMPNGQTARAGHASEVCANLAIPVPPQDLKLRIRGSHVVHVFVTCCVPLFSVSVNCSLNPFITKDALLTFCTKNFDVLP